MISSADEAASPSTYQKKKKESNARLTQGGEEAISEDIHALRVRSTIRRGTAGDDVYVRYFGN